MKPVHHFCLHSIVALCLLVFPGKSFCQTSGQQALQPSLPKVIVSVRPLYGIVAALTQGILDPLLFLESGDSPHTYALKPRDISNLHKADLFIWIGKSYEGFLVRPVHTLSPHKVLTAEALPGLHVLPLRTGGWWAEHSHHEERADTPQHHHGHGHHHHHDTNDGHIWLDPDNAIVIAKAVTERLVKLIPQEKNRLEKNRDVFLQELDLVKKEVTQQTQKIQGHPFVVFHDSYQYFEVAFGLKSAGSVLLDPEMPASAKHIEHLKEALRQRQARCLFKEPQFESTLITTLAEHSGCQQGELDPLGTHVPLSSQHYFGLLRQLAHQLTQCLERDADNHKGGAVNGE